MTSIDGAVSTRSVDDDHSFELNEGQGVMFRPRRFRPDCPIGPQ
jgi:hypothetical protein